MQNLCSIFSLLPFQQFSHHKRNRAENFSSIIHVINYIINVERKIEQQENQQSFVLFVVVLSEKLTAFSRAEKRKIFSHKLSEKENSFLQ